MSIEPRVGVIVDKKVLPDGQILHKVFVPTLHKSIENLPFIPSSFTPAEASSKTNYGAMDKGSWVTVTQNKGEENTGYGTISGVYQNRIDDPELTGNISLKSLWAKFLNEVRDNVKRVESLSKESVNGVEQYIIKSEKDFRLNDFRGFSASLTKELFNKINISQMKNVPTALQSVSSILGASALSNLPGTLFSLGNLKNLLTDDIRREINKVLPANLQQALDTILNNLVTVEGEGRRVNLPILLANIIEELKNVKNIGDLENLLDKIMNDNTFAGTDLLDKLEQIISGPFGDIKLQIDAFGNITETLSDAANQALSAFGGVLSSLPSASGSLFDSIEDLVGIMNTMKLSSDLKNTFEELKKAPKE